MTRAECVKVENCLVSYICHTLPELTKSSNPNVESDSSTVLVRR